VHAKRVSFYLLYVNGNAKNCFLLLLNGTQYARPKNGGTQYARPKLGGTQYARGEGVSPSFVVKRYAVREAEISRTRSTQVQMKRTVRKGRGFRPYVSSIVWFHRFDVKMLKRIYYLPESASEMEKGN